MSGVHELFSQFNDVEVGVGAGPTSSLLWIFQEWLPLLLSFGCGGLRDLIFVFLMIRLSPIKILDLFLERFSGAEKLSSGFYVYAKK